MYIRYNKRSGILSGWADKKVELPLRKGEAYAELPTKPPGDDYEAYQYKNEILTARPPQTLKRDLAAEIDELKIEIAKLKSPL